MKIIAIEEHVLPDEVKHAWNTIPGADDGTLGLNPGVIGERLAYLGEQRLALMDETGVDIQVLSLTTPGLNNLGHHGIDLARRANDLLAEAVAANPSRFQAMAVLPSAEADAAALELRRSVEKLGCKGAVLFGRVGDKSLDHPIFDPTFACATELNVPLMIHPQIPQASVRDAYYSGFSASTDLALSTFGLGWHYEAGIQFVRMVLAGVFDRYPNLQVILGHWGELVIFYLERLAMLDRVSELHRPFIDYVRNNLYLTASGMFSPTYLRQAIEAVGRDRILFSTDYPYQYRPGSDARRFVEALEFEDTDKLRFAHHNWERLTGSRDTNPHPLNPGASSAGDDEDHWRTSPTPSVAPRTNRLMLVAARQIDGGPLVDLYAGYPSFDVDAEAGQCHLLARDVVVFQFTRRWYSPPAQSHG